MYVHIHVRVRQLSPQFELLNCAEFRPAGFSLARVRFDFSKVSNMEFTGRCDFGIPFQNWHALLCRHQLGAT